MKTYMLCVQKVVMRRLKFINGKLIWIIRLNDIIIAAKTYLNFKSV